MNRLWLDANVILRFLTGEPKDMYKLSVQLMERAERGEVKLVVSQVVVAEVIWVLKSFYRNSMSEIADVIVPFIAAPNIEVENEVILIQAIDLARENNVHLIDALLALEAAKHDEAVCTFDKADFKRLPVRWISPPGVEESGVQT